MSKTIFAIIAEKNINNVLTRDVLEKQNMKLKAGKGRDDVIEAKTLTSRDVHGASFEKIIALIANKLEKVLELIPV